MDNSIPPLWKHQKDAVERSFKDRDLAFLFEVGTGKSRTTIECIRHRCAAKNRLLRILIFSPKITLLNWKREFSKYSKIHPRDIVILKGPGKKRVADFLEAVSDNGVLSKGKVIITNYESVQMQELFTALMDWSPEVVVGDEAHRLKNPESKRAKLAIKLADVAEHRYALTGSPILRTVMDIFNIYRFLDGGKTFGTNFWKFRSIWFEDMNAEWQGRQNYYPDFQPRPETYEKFNELIYKKAIRALKSECLDLPPFIRKQVHVDMSPEQARLYKELKNEYVAYIDDIKKTDTPRAVVAQLAVVKSLRMRQIITGFAKDDNGDIYKIKDNPRIEALKELLETYAEHHKIIVWSVFHENYADIKAVCEDLNINYTELHGKVPEKERDRNIDAFNQDAGVRVLIANQAAGGIGINLIASDLCIYYSKDFSLENDIQSEGRNYRGGSEQHSSVTRIDIVATASIDELIDDSLAQKQDAATKVLDWGRSEL